VYNDGVVSLVIDAEDFTEFANFTNPGQEALGGRLDDLRGESTGAGYESLYSIIDLLTSGPLEEGFENLLPHEGFQLRRTVASHGDVFTHALRGRMLAGAQGDSGNGSAQAMFNLMGSETGEHMTGDSLAAAARQNAGSSQPETRDLGNGFEVFFSAGLVDGSAPTTASSADATLEGGFAMAGLDYGSSLGLRLGAAVGFATSESEQALVGGGVAESRVESSQATLYASYQGDQGLQALVAASFGDHNSQARRTAVVGGVNLPVSGTLNASSWSVDAQLSYTVERGQLRLTPVAAVNFTGVTYDPADVTGSPAAFTLLTANDRYSTGRVGLDAGYRIENASFTLEPQIYVGYASRFEKADETLPGDFAGAPGTGGVLIGTGIAPEEDWVELSVGATAHLNNGLSASLAYETRTGDGRVRDLDVLMIGLRTRF